MVSLLIKRILCVGVLLAFISTSLVPPALAQGIPAMLPSIRPVTALADNLPLLRGLKVHLDDPLEFDFILDPGSSVAVPGLNAEANRAIKYFLTALTVPDGDLWVNLSPYEKGRIMPPAFGRTEMGRDLLDQDLTLKQVASRLLHPDVTSGKAFWAKIYARAFEKFGTTDIPLDVFNKVWIIPDEARVSENKDRVYVAGCHLKVMLESDYAALEHSVLTKASKVVSGKAMDLAAQVLREAVLPELERAVNQDRAFARLRQICYAVILAGWYKRKVRGSILERTYVSRNKVAGVDIDDLKMPEKIWARYVEAFHRGEVNLVREERDPLDGEMVPRKYFSGGIVLGADNTPINVIPPEAVNTIPGLQLVHAGANRAEAAVIAPNDVVGWLNAMDTLDPIKLRDAKRHLLHLTPEMFHDYLVSSGLWELAGDADDSWKSVWAVYQEIVVRSIMTPYLNEKDIKRALQSYFNQQGRSLSDMPWNTRLTFVFPNDRERNHLSRDDYMKIYEQYRTSMFPVLAMLLMQEGFSNDDDNQRPRLPIPAVDFNTSYEFGSLLKEINDSKAFIAYLSRQESFLTSEALSKCLSSSKRYKPSEQKRLFWKVLIERRFQGFQELVRTVEIPKGVTTSGKSMVTSVLDLIDIPHMKAEVLKQEEKKSPVTRAFELINFLYPYEASLRNDFSLMLTARCPFNCPMCIAANLRKEAGSNGELSKEEILRRIDMVHGADRIRLLGPGETMVFGKKKMNEGGLSEDFIEVLKAASTAATEVYVITNGILVPQNIDAARAMFKDLPKNIVWVFSVDDDHAKEMLRVQGREIKDLVTVTEQLHQEQVIQAKYYSAFMRGSDTKASIKKYGLEQAADDHRVRVFHVFKEGAAQELAGASERVPGFFFSRHNRFYINLLGEVYGDNYGFYFTEKEKSLYWTDYIIAGNINTMSLSQILIERVLFKIRHEVGSSRSLSSQAELIFMQVLLAVISGDSEQFHRLWVAEPIEGRDFGANWRQYAVESVASLVKKLFEGQFPNPISFYVPHILLLNKYFSQEIASIDFGYLEPLVRATIANLDQAAVARDGGIDLNRAAQAVASGPQEAFLQFAPDPMMLKQYIDAPGFTPIIHDIVPMDNLLQFLKQ